MFTPGICETRLLTKDISYPHYCRHVGHIFWEYSATWIHTLGLDALFHPHPLKQRQPSCSFRLPLHEILTSLIVISLLWWIRYLDYMYAAHIAIGDKRNDAKAQYSSIATVFGCIAVAFIMTCIMGIIFWKYKQGLTRRLKVAEAGEDMRGLMKQWKAGTSSNPPPPKKTDILDPRLRCLPSNSRNQWTQ